MLFRSLVGDEDTVTWREVYLGLADALGVSMDSVACITPPAFRKSFKERVESLVTKPFAQSLLPAFPYQAKRLTKVVLGALKAPPQPNAWTLPEQSAVVVDEEMATLQQCAWKYPNDKAARTLGYQPPVTHAEGLRRTLSWLGFAGYPVRTAVER